MPPPRTAPEPTDGLIASRPTTPVRAATTSREDFNMDDTPRYREAAAQAEVARERIGTRSWTYLLQLCDGIYSMHEDQDSYYNDAVGNLYRGIRTCQNKAALISLFPQLDKYEFLGDTVPIDFRNAVSGAMSRLYQRPDGGDANARLFYILKHLRRSNCTRPTTMNPTSATR